MISFQLTAFLCIKKKQLKNDEKNDHKTTISFEKKERKNGQKYDEETIIYYKDCLFSSLSSTRILLRLSQSKF